MVNSAIGRTNLPRKAENQEEEEEDILERANLKSPFVKSVNVFFDLKQANWVLTLHLQSNKLL